VSNTPITDANVCITTKEGCETIAPDICRKFERENAAMREQLARICKEGFDNQDTIGQEPADDYVLRQLAAMREAIGKAHGFARNILKNYECGDDIDCACEHLIEKLQPFLKP
jgi:hypothetical protein